MRFKNFNIFWKESLLFILTQCLGIFVAIRLYESSEIFKAKPQQISLFDFLVYFFIITLIILIFFKISRKGGGILLQIFFILAIFSGLKIFFSTFLKNPEAIILAGVLILARFIWPTIFIHNLVVIGGIAGIGGMLGLAFSPQDVIIILIILAIYDIIAVYKTKHMVKMAKAMIKKRVILGLIIPKRILEFKASMAEVERNKISPAEKFGIKGKTHFLILGGGDLALPLLLIASVACQNLLRSIVILFFSFLGLLTMHFIFTKLKNKPMPALPPLAVFSILGYFISLLV